MRLLNKSFLIGVGAGLALALVMLDAWAHQFDREIITNGNPWILRPLKALNAPAMPTSSEKLPTPWLPQTTGRLHDNWAVRSLDGKTLRLSDLKGKVVFLNFWRTSCGPCIAEMPGIERLYDSLRGENIFFLSVSDYETPDAVRGFMVKNRLRIPVYLAGNDLPQDLPAVGVPATYVMDREGRAVFRLVGDANWDDDRARSFLRALEKG